ncbi:hypothetical protein K7X08_031694 [Anisodus acutangulus]|uniref:Glucose/Sorbosone dehydrogenase domain-containing protein n=1 Tax=Anisodus acutangulus TaxID=402998 RepID=A0A9Q1MS66_9SOLA|nr:hypothetical protein K7X08_031694 [Anisodus acutangulus]
MMRSPFVIFIFLFNFLQLLDPTFSLPLCTDSRAPLQLKAPLAFCPYNGTSCSNSADDKQLQTQFNAMNISDPGCASLVKSIVCAQSYSELIPFLDNFLSCAAPQLQQIQLLSNQAKNDFCSKVWTTCQNVSIVSSPFATSAKSNSTKLTDQWKSQTDFCSTFGGASGDGSVCFAGEPVTLNTTTPLSPPGGKIWLATIPKVDSGELLDLDDANPFLDLTDVHFDTELGMMGIAFHPKCGLCPSKLPRDSGSQPCQYEAVIAEFIATGQVKTPTQRKWIFVLHDGDGGGIGDPYNFAQNKKSLLGKIIRLDVDRASKIMKLGLWGNYSIPKDNPYIEDKDLQPEIWALGMRNPWWCSFDSARPSYFMCADVGQDKFEEVNIVSKGDLYAGSMWAENSEDSGIFNTTEISFNCAKRSPIECTFVPGSSVPALGYIFSYAGPPAASPSAAIMLTGSYNNFVLMFLSFMLMLASWF